MAEYSVALYEKVELNAKPKRLIQKLLKSSLIGGSLFYLFAKIAFSPISLLFFSYQWSRKLRFSTWHSSNGRFLQLDRSTDFYGQPLQQRCLRYDRSDTIECARTTIHGNSRNHGTEGTRKVVSVSLKPSCHIRFQYSVAFFSHYLGWLKSR